MDPEQPVRGGIGCSAQHGLLRVKNRRSLGVTEKGVSWAGHRTRCYSKAVPGEGREERKIPERFPNLPLRG